MNAIIRNSAIGATVFATALVAANFTQRGLVRLGWIDSPVQSVAAAAPLMAVGLPDPSLAAAVPRHNSNPLRHLTQLPGGGRVVETPVAPWTLAAPYIRTALLVDGVAQPVSGDEPVALPGGTRFRLQVSSGEAALVEVHALNAQGVPSTGPLWRGVVAAHGTAETPRLRLEGLGGMETLRVLRRSLLDGTTTEEQVQVLHL